MSLDCYRIDIKEALITCWCWVRFTLIKEKKSRASFFSVGLIHIRFPVVKKKGKEREEKKRNRKRRKKKLAAWFPPPPPRAAPSSLVVQHVFASVVRCLSQAAKPRASSDQRACRRKEAAAARVVFGPCDLCAAEAADQLEFSILLWFGLLRGRFKDICYCLVTATVWFFCYTK